MLGGFYTLTTVSTGNHYRKKPIFYVVTVCSLFVEVIRKIMPQQLPELGVLGSRSG
jgi:hypothetical protein